MFAADRDLLVFEPSVFADLAFLGQRLSTGTAEVSEFALATFTPDVAFDAAGINTGYVIVVNAAPCEILTRIGPLELTISRLRAHRDDPPIPPVPDSAATYSVVSFRPQLRAVHESLLRALGIEPDGPPLPRAPSPADITNPHAFRRVEALGALALIYNAAGALRPDDDPLNQRARRYAAWFEHERERLTAFIDTNGDGLPDTTRKISGGAMVR
jgi:hypothetical protein